MKICGLCEREIPDELKSRHHLVPKCKGGVETEYMHQICHSKIHSLFSESELMYKYNTLEQLLESEEIQKFLNWVKKKPIDFKDTNVMCKNLKLRKKKK